jgi:hypothetical protein
MSFFIEFPSLQKNGILALAFFNGLFWKYSFRSEISIKLRTFKIKPFLKGTFDKALT